MVGCGPEAAGRAHRGELTVAVAPFAAPGMEAWRCLLPPRPGVAVADMDLFRWGRRRRVGVGVAVFVCGKREAGLERGGGRVAAQLASAITARPSRLWCNSTLGVCPRRPPPSGGTLCCTSGVTGCRLSACCRWSGDGWKRLRVEAEQVVVCQRSRRSRLVGL